METKTLTRADVIALLARRLRECFGNEILRLYALPEDPHEPDEMGFAVTLVVVAEESMVDQIINLSVDLNGELGYLYPAFVYVISAREFEDQETGVAQAARETGVPL